MAKKELDNKSLIHFELEKLEEKVNEFQTYLQLNSIIRTKEGYRIDDVNLPGEYQDKLHKEILVQIKIQDALFSWVPLLAKLREVESDKTIKTRGDVEVSGLFKSKQTN